jgi:hypothetical protein
MKRKRSKKGKLQGTQLAFEGFRFDPTSREIRDYVRDMLKGYERRQTLREGRRKQFCEKYQGQSAARTKALNPRRRKAS